MRIAQRLREQRQRLCARLLQRLQRGVAHAPIWILHPLADFVQAKLAPLLDELRLAAAVGDRLRDDAFQPFRRICSFQLLLDLAGDIGQLAIAHAVIGELTLLDQRGAGHLGYSVHEPLGQRNPFLTGPRLHPNLHRNAAKKLHEHLRLPVT